MQNLVGIYELDTWFAPELIWYKNQCGNIETQTNGRFYLIVEKKKKLFQLIIKKEMKTLGDFEVNSLENGKMLAEHIEGFYCSMEKIDMIVEE